MKASELIGKIVLRKAPAIINGNKDHSWTTDPVYIENVTENHIFFKTRFASDVSVLDYRYMDDNWIEWPKNIHVPGAKKMTPVEDEG